MTEATFAGFKRFDAVRLKLLNSFTNTGVQLARNRRPSGADATLYPNGHAALIV